MKIIRNLNHQGSEPKDRVVQYYKTGDSKPKYKYGTYSELDKWIDKVRSGVILGISSVGSIEYR